MLLNNERYLLNITKVVEMYTFNVKATLQQEEVKYKKGQLTIHNYIR